MTTSEVAQLVLDEALRYDIYDRVPTTPDEVRRITGRNLSVNASRFLERMTVRLIDRSPPAMPDRPGFKVHGRLLTDAYCPDGACHSGQDGGLTTVSVDTQGRQSQALLEFDDGTGVLLPVFNRYVGVLRFQEGRLDEVWYEPANQSDATASRMEIDFLRQAVIGSSVLGIFALQGEDSDRLAQRMQNMKFHDPALAVYAAYAYHDAGQFRRIGHMHKYLQTQLGVQLYDLALLSRGLLRDADLAEQLVPRLPLLSQGWALIDALHGRIPGELGSLRKKLRPSLWSLYTPDGTAVLREWMREQGQAIQTKEAIS